MQCTLGTIIPPASEGRVICLTNARNRRHICKKYSFFLTQSSYEVKHELT